MKFAFYTLGCKTNQYETQAMERILTEMGHEIGHFDEACDGYVINTCSVTAVADDGYIFKRWSDGNTNPTRTDLAVNEDVTYTAEFVKVDDEEGNDPGEGQGDKPSDAPGDGSSGGEDGDSDDEQDPDKKDENSGAGGAYEPNNKVIDGNTYYRDLLEEYQDALEELLQDPESGLSDEERELIKKYLGIV